MKTRNSNRILTTILVAGMGLVLSSCGDTKPKEKLENEQTTETTPKTTDTIEASAPMNQAQSILAAYLNVKDALVGTDGEAASVAAKELASAIDKGDDEFTDILAAAEGISGSTDTEKQRELFNTLSQKVYELVKSTSPNEAPVYKQFCPMAFGNTGAYWLSTEEEVFNPYFGDKMLKCGRVEETIE
ncbi:MAG: DUF3347 domain-containing protein [Cytophagales bacterium]|nr:DUF3347 domain-containing protein [Cytophagales bacterium]